MTLHLTGVIFLVLHLVCCIAVYMGICLGILKVRLYLMPIVVLVPLWGLLCVLTLHFQAFIHGRKRMTGIEKMKIEEEHYRSIFIGNQENQEEIIPMEEALLMNDSQIRRQMIMDVLYDNPEEYMELLDRARMNEDVEVVHYAATAMAELSKQYDFELQKWEKSYSQNPGNPEMLDGYCEFLKGYLERGLVEGQMEMVQRNQYSQLLTKRLERKESLEVYAELADNQMKLRDYNQAAETISQIGKKWQDREEFWMLKIKYYALQKLGGEIEAILKETEEKNIYFSAENRQRLSFWQQKTEPEGED